MKLFYSSEKLLCTRGMLKFQDTAACVLDCDVTIICLYLNDFWDVTHNYYLSSTKVYSS